MYKAKGKKFSANGISIKFVFDIAKVIEYGEQFIILLDVPAGDDTINNIFCFNADLSVAWRAERLEAKYPIIKKYPYVGIELGKDELIAYDFLGRRFSINLSDGKINGYTAGK